jgi:hypothetical protein
MALATCKVCGKRINKKAKACSCCEKMPFFVKCEIVLLIVLFAMLMITVKHIPRNPPIKNPPIKQSAAQEQEAESAAGILFNIPKLAGKTEAEIETLLGESVFCAKSESTLNCSYRENEIEVVFIDGKADWITVYSAFRSPSYHQKIEGKTKAETLKLLGDPVFCMKAKSALHCAFRDGDVSVEFIDEKVDEIIVKGNLSRAAYSKDTLAMLGLPVKDATFSNKNVMRWENISGLLSVTLHSEGNFVSFVTVKAKTK